MGVKDPGEAGTSRGVTNPGSSEADMAKDRGPCTVPNCQARAWARQMCKSHYARWHATGSPIKACKGCGQELRGRGSHEYCGVTCRPTCVIDDCGAPAVHADSTLCLGHHAQKTKYGTATPYRFRWAERGPCLVCGVVNDDYRLRAYCSFSCYQLWLKYDGDVPTSKPCLACDEPIDLMEVGKGGQRKHRVVVFCKPCGNRRTKYNGANVRMLANRDGTDCALCHEPIDMDLRRNHSGGFMCASVDHITPQSRGGTHDPENLQLAHLLCNLRKSDRPSLPVEEVAP